MNNTTKCLILSTALFLLGACSAQGTTPPSPTPTTIDCTPILPHADYATDADWDAFAEGADSIIDYRPDHEWVTFDPGETPRTLGFAAAEDDAIYRHRSCI